eukprot:s8424_g1.t1
MARTVRPRVTTPRRTTTNPRQGHRTPTRTRPNEINHSKHGSDLGHPGAEINHNKPSKINHNKPNEINRNKPDEISRNKLDGTGHGANTGDVYMTEDWAVVGAHSIVGEARPPFSTCAAVAYGLTALQLLYAVYCGVPLMVSQNQRVKGFCEWHRMAMAKGASAKAGEQQSLLQPVYFWVPSPAACYGYGFFHLRTLCCVSLAEPDVQALRQVGKLANGQSVNCSTRTECLALLRDVTAMRHQKEAEAYSMLGYADKALRQASSAEAPGISCNWNTLQNTQNGRGLQRASRQNDRYNHDA